MVGTKVGCRLLAPRLESLGLSRCPVESFGLRRVVVCQGVGGPGGGWGCGLFLSKIPFFFSGCECDFPEYTNLSALSLRGKDNLAQSLRWGVPASIERACNWGSEHCTDAEGATSRRRVHDGFGLSGPPQWWIFWQPSNQISTLLSSFHSQHQRLQLHETYAMLPMQPSSLTNHYREAIQIKRLFRTVLFLHIFHSQASRWREKKIQKAGLDTCYPSALVESDLAHQWH